MFRGLIRHIKARLGKDKMPVIDVDSLRGMTVGDLYAHPASLAYHLGLMKDSDIGGKDPIDVYGDALAKLYRAGYPVHVEKVSVLVDLGGGRVGYGDFVRINLAMKNIVYDKLLKK